MTTAIVLAAGASSRLGQPKALVPVNGRPAIARLCATLREAGCTVVVVLGANADPIRAAVPLFAKILVNPSWDKGRTGTFQIGLRSLWRDENVVLAPVDHPAITVRTISALLRAKGEIRIPTFEGRHGHPVFFSRALRDEILELEPDEPLNRLVNREPARVTEVQVEDPAVLLNIDTPDDLKKLERHLQGGSHARDAA